jgi:hypothetical protein
MKTAIYIEDGTIQVVLTPENEFEKNVVHSLQGKKPQTNVFIGSFYDCRGGWVRQSSVPDILANPHVGHPLDAMKNEDKSLILRLNTRPPDQPATEKA